MSWSEWQKLDPKARPRNPYIDWSAFGPGEESLFPQETHERLQDQSQQLESLGSMADPQASLRSLFVFSAPALIDFLPDKDRFVFDELAEIALPRHALNPNFGEKPIEIKPPDENKLPGDPAQCEDETPLEEDTIIAGVIDVGIPLGHRRFRFADGRTRVLAAWQMIGEWGRNPDEKRVDLPFGCEFYEAEINRLLAQHSYGDMTGWLDEDAFNRATGSLSYDLSLRQSVLGQRASHGAHVTDMVAGANAKDEAEKAFAKRVRIIAVNAPSSAVFGASGTYLDAYMLNAVQRIVDTADGLWRKNHGGKELGKGDGYKIVINMSFGKQAGSKDTIDRFASLLVGLQKYRKRKGLSPVHIVMPAGNDNLDRCSAFLEPDKDQRAMLDWRIAPQDQSSNFVEFWTSDFSDMKGNKKPEATFPPMEIWAQTPNGTEAAPGCLPEVTLGETYLSTLENSNGEVMAHLYLRRVAELERTSKGKGGQTGKKSDNRAIKFQHILCVAPTYRHDAQPAAPAGRWRLIARNLHDERLQTVLSVQTDQGLTPNRSVNLRSYFDDAGYVSYAADGRLLESYAYPPGYRDNDPNLDIDAQTPVRRHGTMNASAAHDAVARVAGYRASDGRPAPYSSTGRGRTSGADDGTILGSNDGKGRAYAPTASFPTDDGPAHFGILSAGSADGSCVAMRGTSFASSQGARLVILQLMDGNNSDKPNGILFKLAKDQESKAPAQLSTSDALIEVRGGGRLKSPLERSPARRGKDFYDAYD